MAHSSSRPLHLAIEASAATAKWPSGIGRYAVELLHGLSALPEAESLRITRLYEWSRFKKRKRLRSLPGDGQRLWHDRWLPPLGFDVLLATGHWLPSTRRVPKVATVHDLYVLDGGDLVDPIDVQLQAGFHRRVAQQADHVICVSDSTRRDFLRHFPDYDPAHAHAVHLGVNPRFRPHDEATNVLTRARFTAGERYVLYMGALRRNKNVERLVEAYAKSAVHKDLKLLIAGHKGDHAERLRALLVHWGVAHRAVLVDYLADADVPLLYAAASALALPSLYEGFGLPILEAMASGVPVLTSTAGSCPEVAAGHAVLADPRSVTDIAAGLDATLARSPADLAIAQTYAASKTWQRTAQQTLEILSRAAARN